MSARLFLGTLALVAAALFAWLWRAGMPPAPGADTATPVQAASAPEPGAPLAVTEGRDVPAAESPGTAAASEGDEPEEHAARHHDHGSPSEDLGDDLALYAQLPMSPVPHQVARGWGARGAGKVPGVVGAYVVVDPGIADDQLATLAGDIRTYHLDADVLSVRILDSQEAATYDRHRDGGELAANHLVGLVNRNTRLGMDRIEIRGRTLDPDDLEAP